MDIHGAASRQSIEELGLLYHALNDQRVAIDRRIMDLPNDHSREALWQEQELVLAKLRDVVGHLANNPAAHVSELRVKAVVLATLLRPEDPNGGPVISEDERAALALSLTDDIARLVGGS